ncbi:hypothetical protein H0H92_000872 [Tricholoma furcatifolium]|nr:hypothetical protein H0H92_000872 [Tricholoma furcatifolium]
MASFLQQALQVLTPPPVIIPSEYDGLEYRWKFFTFRPALFQLELYLLGGICLYFAITLAGIYRNKSKATEWHVLFSLARVTADICLSRFKAYLPLLENQFSKPLGQDGLRQDGYSDFYTFSTGRRNIASLHTVFTLQPRHDFFQYLFQVARTFVDLHHRPKDDVTLDFTLAPDALSQDFVWAIVAKDELMSIKDNRWDLTFTKTSENPALPSSLSIMSEFADITDNLLKPSLVALLTNPKVLPYFRSLSVTDQTRFRPDTPLPAEKRKKHVILSLSLPSGRVEDVSTLISGLFPFIDSLHTVSLRPETKMKIKKARDELEKQLKTDAEREKKEEESQAVEDRKAAKRREEQERISKLPAAEQQKIMEKERKRALRKSQGKMVRK